MIWTSLNLTGHSHAGFHTLSSGPVFGVHLISILSGAHQTLVPELLAQLRARGLGHVRVVVGGIIPDEDIPALLGQGVAQVFTPGTPLPRIAEFFRGL